MNLPEVFLNNRKGFTLIELLLVASLVMIVGMFMFPLSISFYRLQMLNETEEGITRALRTAQLFSISEKNENAYGVKVLQDSYILFEGLSYDSRNVSSDEMYPIPSSITVTGLDEVVFAHFMGSPSATGTILISSDYATVAVGIRESGIIDH